MPGLKKKIKGKVISLPVENGKGFQQRIALDAANLTALKAEEKALKDEGKGKMTKQLQWGREGHEYCYVSATPDAAMPGSGREVGDEVEIIVKVNGDYLNCIAVLSDAAKAKADVEKAAALREQAVALKENKTMMSLLRSLKVNTNLVQLALVQKVTGQEIGVGFGAALAAMQRNTDETPVSRSSKLSSDSKEEKRNVKRNVLAKPDEDEEDLDGED